MDKVRTQATPDPDGNVWFMERFVTQLDENVCGDCAEFHGMVYNIGSGPEPPIHPNCRCYRMLVPPGTPSDPFWETDEEEVARSFDHAIALSRRIARRR